MLPIFPKNACCGTIRALNRQPDGGFLVSRYMGMCGQLCACWMLLLASDANGQVSVARKSLHQEYRLGTIRVFYDTEGVHSVDGTDTDRNAVPDQVEDIAKQTWAAQTLFVQTLDFPDPFKSERYRDATFLDIHLLAKSTLGSNGVAYDEVQRFHRPGDAENTGSLCFNVATSVKANSNLTPAHETFHLIQYGVTYFKNAWYSEGMARWSEMALGSGGIGEIRYRKPFPLTEANVSKLFEMSYDASVDFWNPLAAMDDSQGRMPEHRVSPRLKELTYSDGTKVLKDLQLNGYGFMWEVLLELGKVEDVAFRELGYERWSEANQKSKKNSPYIYATAMTVARRRIGTLTTQPAPARMIPQQ
jgi:hypothetical protein